LLTPKQVMILRQAGFIPYEIAKYSAAVDRKGNAQNIDLTTGTWQGVISKRRSYVTAMIKKGWSRQKITDAFMRFYSQKKGSQPFDWLKVEYKPPRKLTDFAFAVKMRANAQIRRSFGSGYGSKFTPVQRRPLIP
jgi:hypothetical protein